MKLLFQKEKELRCTLHSVMGFYPHNIQLYRIALCHRSLNHNENNERLEFLGDAVLDLVVADILFRQYKWDEGRLTQVRSRIVSRESLGRLSTTLGIAALVRSNLTGETSHNSYMAGNALEAFVGAIYLDQGYRRCQRFVEQRVIPLIDEAYIIARSDNNFKSRLLEWCQKRHITVRYEIEEHPDPDCHKSSPVFTSVVLLNDVEMGKGCGYSKKEATQSASHVALDNLRCPQKRSLLRW